ncbi:MAG: hypothetical protein NC253_14210 [Ruminococcus sp.]|nr:hypothetical protein [Ruminococcus sp.]MCM1382586.1 hypothetical protein [Muribaculaceae bacterium]
MYKYKCLAAKNADKADFYRVTDELKALYPNMTANEDIPSDREFLRRKFWQGEKIVTVQYSFSERTVTVFSEEWLGKFYEDKEVAEGRFIPKKSTPSNGTMWIFSGVFFAVTAVLFFIIDNILDDYFSIIATLILAAVYTMSGINIRRRVDVPLLKLAFWQAGGYITVIMMLIFSNELLLNEFFSFYIFDSVMYSLYKYILYWFVFCLPALEISCLIQAVIGLIMKKINSPKTAATENIAENNE